MEFHHSSVEPPRKVRAASGAETRALGALVDLRGGMTSPDRFVVIESCHSTWLFVTADRRFCRVVRDDANPSGVPTDWRPYDRLVVEDDTDAFVIFLDASGTRLLRSWRHTSDCDHCDRDLTSEMSLADIHRVTRA